MPILPEIRRRSKMVQPYFSGDVIPGSKPLPIIERMLKEAEGLLGLRAEDRKSKSATAVYNILQDLFFSVPISPDQDTWDQATRDAVFEKYLQRDTGMTKTVFLAKMRTKLRTNSMRRMREKAIKKNQY